MISYWNIVIRNKDGFTISNELVKFNTKFPKINILKSLYKNDDIIYMRKIEKGLEIPPLMS